VLDGRGGIAGFSNRGHGEFEEEEEGDG
jgi:hypothetical protein